MAARKTQQEKTDQAQKPAEDPKPAADENGDAPAKVSVSIETLREVAKVFPIDPNRLRNSPSEMKAAAAEIRDALSKAG